MSDPLLDCLLELTRLYGKPLSAAALCAGLPLEQGKLTPGLFARAAHRAALSSQLHRTNDIGRDLLPLIVLLQDEQACIVLAMDQDGASVLFPGAGQGVTRLSHAELAARHLGWVISCRPQWQAGRTDPPRPAHQPQSHWFWGALHAQHRLLTDVLLAAFLINLFGLALPLYTMNVYDRVVPNFAEDTLWVLSLGIALVLGLDAAMRLTRNHFMELASARIDVQLSREVMQRVLALPLALRPASVGGFAANVRAFEMVRDFLAAASLTALVDLPFALLYLLALGWIAWQLLIIPVLACAVLLGYSAWVQRPMQALSASTLTAQAARNATLVESLSALESVQAHNLQGQLQGKWEQASTHLAHVHSQLRRLAARTMQAVLSGQQLVNVAMVMAGVYLIHQRTLSLGGLIASTMLAGRALGPLAQMVNLMLQSANAKNALASLNTIMQAHPAPAATALMPRLTGAIEFQHVSFRYPGASAESVHDMSFRIQAGEKVVVVGRVGSGKSTLQKLILGLYPPETGHILFDGMHQNQFAIDELRQQIGYAEQDTRLFCGTLRDNLMPAGPLIDDAVLWQALDMAGLADLVKRHPLGLNWPISERGESLSGGQRQALALARALVSDAPILLLDEPSSALDHASESQFKQRLRQFADGKTMIIITHRASLMDLADRIMVIDDGVLVADGQRDSIIAALQSGTIGRAAP